MKYYELVYLVSPGLSESEVRDIQQELNSFIQEKGGVLDSSILPEKIDLSYRIKKEIQAFLVSQSFYLKPEEVNNLDNKIKTENKILRFLLLNKKKLKEEKAPRRRMIKKSEKKAELKDIEQKLEEILG